MYNAHSAPLFVKLKILKLSDLHKQYVSKFVLSFLRETIALSLSTFTFTMAMGRHAHITRQSVSFKLQPPRLRSNLGAKSLIKTGPEIWNSISCDLYLTRGNEALVSPSCFASRFRRVTLTQYSLQQ